MSEAKGMIKRMRLRGFVSVLTACSIASSLFYSFPVSADAGEGNEKGQEVRTDFVTSEIDINEMLKREYIDNVPLGYNEDLFSLYQPGWGFDKTDVYRTGVASGFGMPVSVLANGVPVTVKDAEFTPAYVTSEYSKEQTAEPEPNKINLSLNAKSVYHGAPAEEYPRVDASFSQERWGRSLAQAFQGVTGGDASNWNTFRLPEDFTEYPVPEGGDWTTVEFSKSEEINEIRIHTFVDGNLVNPEKITAYAWNTDKWVEIASSTESPVEGWSALVLSEAVSSEKFKVAMEVADGKALGVDSIEYVKYDYENAGLEKIEINEALGAGRNESPLAATSFSQEKWGASLEYAFDGDRSATGNNSWNNYREADDAEKYPIPAEGDWISLKFDESKTVQSLALYVYSDGGSTAPPADVKLLYCTEGSWNEVNYKNKPTSFRAGKNVLQFDEIQADEYKIIFAPQAGKCVSMNEIELIRSFEAKPQNILVEGHKYISPDNMLVTIIKAVNKGDEALPVEVAASLPLGLTADGSVGTGELAGFKAKIQGDSGFTVKGKRVKKQIVLEPGQSEEFKIVTALSDSQEENDTKISQFLSDMDPLGTQKTSFTNWFKENIPYLDVPDENFLQTYYFRWYTYRNHIRKTTEDSYIISEFLPNVPWAGKHNSINCPAGLHVTEGRWIRNQEYLDDYLAHWLDNGGAVRSYSFWIADAFYNRYLTTGDPLIFDYVEKLKANYEAWGDHYNEDLGLYWQLNDRDGMENSISSAFGYRPTINSYMYGDAMAISKLCSLTGDLKGASLYAEKAAEIKEKFDDAAWDKEDRFYKVMASDSGGNLTNGTNLQDVKEEIGYIPWMFNMPDDNAQYSAAWDYLMDENYFLSPFGILTAEKSKARLTPEGEYGTGICRWDGPVWPFATSQTLIGMANLLNNYNQESVTDDDYFYLLKNYSDAQYKNGDSWIAEDLDGYTGRWIADEKRSPNYNHSSFNDLVISGLFGIRSSEGESVTINPLIPEGEWSNFCLENVPYHGKNITLLYDKTGEVYGQGAGYKVILDGEVVHSSQSPDKVQISLKKKIELEKITLTPPVKQEYQVGEKLDTNGLKVTAYYNDKTSRVLKSSEYKVSSFNSATAGRKTVTVEYSEAGITKSAAFTVSVKVPVNRGSIQAYYNSVASKKNTGYTTSSWNTFVKARNSAKALLSNPQATQAQLDQALASLKKAKANLVETIQKNKVYSYRNLKYKVTSVSGNRGTVIVTGAVSKNIKTVTIPNTVTIKKVKCTVSGIDKKAFYNYKKLKSVTIGENVKVIGTQAFEKASSLKTIRIKSTRLNTVKKNALKGINRKAVIKVPKKKLTSYKKLMKNKGQYRTVKIIY